MGFQLVASRLLAPFFGTTIIVWAFLISTFLAAFSAGSFIGGALSRLPMRRKINALVILGVAGAAGFAVAAFLGRSLLRYLDLTFTDATPGIFIACMLLFFLPVIALSSLLPVYADLVGKDRGAGLSSGLVYGTSTFGNIAGVILTAFALIPNFPTSELLIGWFAASTFCFAAAPVLVRGSLAA
ncbi:MAG TPA: fused MFS/spermidine synthase [Xanthobacteraceae bacterium]|nr:fused MFS/spermidine synthase [Xanthobacteraceae bacterium]